MLNENSINNRRNSADFIGKLLLITGMVFVAVFLILLVLSGASLSEFVLYIVCAVAYVFLPGYFLKKILKADYYLPDFDITLDFFLGTALLVLTYCIGMLISAIWILKVIPLCTGLAGLFLLFKKSEKNNIRTLFGIGSKKIGTRLLFFLVCALIFVYGWSGVVKYTHPSVAGEVIISQDFLFNVGNAESFGLSFPPKSIQYSGIVLKYHFLTEMICYCFSYITGITCYNILAFYQQPVFLLVLVFSLHNFGLFYFGNKYDKRKSEVLSLVFTFSMFAFGCAGMWALLPNNISPFGNSSIAHLVTNINSHTTAVIYLTVFTALYLQAAKNRFDIKAVPFILTELAIIMLTFAKSPVGAIMACAVIVTVIILAIGKKASLKGLVFSLILSGTFFLILLTVFSASASDNLTFTAIGTLYRSCFSGIVWKITTFYPTLGKITIPLLIILHTILNLPASQTLFYISGIKKIKSLFMLEAPELISFSASIGGLIVYYIFEQSAASQMYFFMMAIFFINLIAIDEGNGAVERLKKNGFKYINTLEKIGTVIVAVGITIGLITAGFSYVNLCGSGLRRLMTNYDIIRKFPYDCIATDEDEAAAMWLRENTDASQCMFATNRIHSGTSKEGISNYYTAISGRQAFVECIKYTCNDAEMNSYKLSVLNTIFSEDSTPEEIVNVCHENGITHILYSTQYAGCVEGSNFVISKAFDCVFDTYDAKIYVVPQE